MVYPHCKDCDKLISYNPFGYIVCRSYGTSLGYNYAVGCDCYRFAEEREIPFIPGKGPQCIIIEPRPAEKP